jgi:hypothetical protein
MLVFNDVSVTLNRAVGNVPEKAGGPMPRHPVPPCGRGRTAYAVLWIGRTKGRPTLSDTTITGDNDNALRAELERLRQEHRDLDEAIAAMDETGKGDPLRKQRLKKRKLLLKDRIVTLEDRLTPDIIA